MLAALAKHGRFDLDLTVQGDLEVDAHHTVEDVGLCLGEAFRQALGDKANITRFGQACVPMDEAWCWRSGPLWSGLLLRRPSRLGRGSVGDHGRSVSPGFPVLAYRGGITLHVRVLAGGNWHHMAEAAFKAVAVALRQACSRDQSARDSFHEGDFGLGERDLQVIPAIDLRAGSVCVCARVTPAADHIQRRSCRGGGGVCCCRGGVDSRGGSGWSLQWFLQNLEVIRSITAHVPAHPGRRRNHS